MVLPATRQMRHFRLYPSKAGARFSDPGGLQGRVACVREEKNQWIRSKYEHLDFLASTPYTEVPVHRVSSCHVSLMFRYTFLAELRPDDHPSFLLLLLFFFLHPR